MPSKLAIQCKNSICIFRLILVGKVQQLAYMVYACMPNFIGVHMILDMHRMTCSFFPYDFLSFQHFSGSDNFTLFKTLLLYVCPLFVLGRDRFFAFYIFLNKTYFSISKYSLFLLHTIIGSSGKDRVLIILFQLYGWALMLGFFKVIYSESLSMQACK